MLRYWYYSKHYTPYIYRGGCNVILQETSVILRNIKCKSLERGRYYLRMGFLRWLRQLKHLEDLYLEMGDVEIEQRRIHSKLDLILTQVKELNDMFSGEDVDANWREQAVAAGWNKRRELRNKGEGRAEGE